MARYTFVVRKTEYGTIYGSILCSQEIDVYHYNRSEHAVLSLCAGWGCSCSRAPRMFSKEPKDGVGPANGQVGYRGPQAG